MLFRALVVREGKRDEEILYEPLVSTGMRVPGGIVAMSCYAQKPCGRRSHERQEEVDSGIGARQFTLYMNLNACKYATEAILELFLVLLLSNRHGAWFVGNTEMGL